MKPKTCIECHKEFTKKKIQRIRLDGKKQWVCVFCKRKRRDKKRDILLHTIGGVRRREDILREAKEKRKRIFSFQRIKRAVFPSVFPSIKSAKPKRRLSTFGMYLTKEEKQILFKKYCLNGLNPEEANKKVKQRVEFLSKLVQKLRAEKKSEKEINERFKEEFAKLCESFRTRVKK